MYYDRVLSTEEALYVSRAQQKIAELTALMAHQWANNDVDEYLKELALELEYSTQVLRSSTLDWTADDIQMMTDYYTLRGELIALPFRSIFFDPTYTDPGSGQVWATVPQLEALRTESEAYDAYLLSLINQEILDRIAGDLALQLQIDEIDLNASGTLTAEIVSAVDVGGIRVGDVFPIGTTLEALWNAILSAPKELYNFTFDSFVPIVEVGDNLLITQLTWSDIGNPTNMLLNDSDGQLVNQTVTGNSYSPAAGEPMQNLLLWSENGDNAVWKTDEVNVIADDLAYPTGGYFADKYAATAITTLNSNHNMWQEISKDGSIIVYTFSGIFRADENDKVMLRMLGGNFVDGNRGGAYRGFDLTNGVALTIGSGNFGAFNLLEEGIEDEGGGWYRCWIKAESDAGTDVSFNFGDYSSGEGNSSDGFHFRALQINYDDLKSYTETTSVPIDTPGVAGLTYNFNAQAPITWTLSGDGVPDVVIDVTAFYRSYYYKETASDDDPITPTEAKILAGTATFLGDTATEVILLADTGNSDQGVIAVPQTQTGSAYLKWFVDNTNFSDIASGGFIQGPTTVVVSGVDYDVYQWGYRSPLIANLKLHR